MDTKKLKPFFHKLYHFSVSVFILGMVFAANGWGYSSEMIIIGGVPLAIIFFLRSFAPPESN
jgi:hypothetical protein